MQVLEYKGEEWHTYGISDIDQLVEDGGYGNSGGAGSSNAPPAGSTPWGVKSSQVGLRAAL